MHSLLSIKKVYLYTLLLLLSLLNDRDEICSTLFNIRYKNLVLVLHILCNFVKVRSVFLFSDVKQLITIVSVNSLKNVISFCDDSTFVTLFKFNYLFKLLAFFRTQWLTVATIIWYCIITGNVRNNMVFK